MNTSTRSTNQSLNARRHAWPIKQSLNKLLYWYLL